MVCHRARRAQNALAVHLEIARTKLASSTRLVDDFVTLASIATPPSMGTRALGRLYEGSERIHHRSCLTAHLRSKHYEGWCDYDNTYMTTRPAPDRGDARR